MQICARCACGHVWYVAPELAGGLSNCPRCGKATPIEGLKDPFWRVLQAGAVVLWVVVVAALYASAGFVGAIAAGAILAAVYALLYAMM